MGTQGSRMMLVAVAAMACVTLAACSKSGDKGSAAGAASATVDPAAPSLDDKGIGPVKSVTVDAIDPQKVAQGQKLFQDKCSACHKMDEKYIGPALKDVTKRRSAEWVMNMILNPMEMTQKDPVAKQLLATYFTQMTFQNVTQDEARALLEFFRQNDSR